MFYGHKRLWNFTFEAYFEYKVYIYRILKLFYSPVDLCVIVLIISSTSEWKKLTFAQKMPRGATSANRKIDTSIVKREPVSDFPSSLQIINVASIYRQPLSATKDSQGQFHSSWSLQGGFTPNGPCVSPVTDVKPCIGRPQVNFRTHITRWKGS